MKKIILMSMIALSFSACSFFQSDKPVAAASKEVINATNPATKTDQVVIQKIDKDDVRDVIRQEKMLAYDTSGDELSFSAVGEGIAPMNTISPAQALAMAKRAAITDAYRQLASKLYGVKVNAKDTVKDAMLKSSVVSAQVNGLIKNASVTDEDFKDGLYRVSVEMKIDASKWKELFSY